MRAASANTYLAFLGALLMAGFASSIAYGDLFGGDLPLLSGILAQSTQAAATLGSTLSTLQRTYQDTKKMAAYADDAYRAYTYFKSYNARLFKVDVTNALESSYPELGYFQREASGAGTWAQGSGEFQRMAKLCLAGPNGSCRMLQEAISYRQARSALAATFGESPAGAPHMAAVDHEAAVALAAGSAQQGRSQWSRNLSDNLITQCEGADGDDSTLAGCQAAAGTAQIQALKQQADIADQAAESNRLQALQLEQSNMEQKRQLQEADERRSLVVEAVGQAVKPPVPMVTEGFDLFEGSPP